jgi:nucleoid-associated protein YgaU
MLWEANRWMEAAISAAASLAAIGCTVRFGLHMVGKRIRIRRPRPRPVVGLRVLVFTGLGGLAAPAAASPNSNPEWTTDVGSPTTVQPSAGDPAFAPPWSDSAGSHPPRPFDRTREGPPPSVGSPPARANAGRSRGIEDHYTVELGDTLWDISSRVLDTTDGRRIASYWPLIHRHNRNVIGPDPDLIRPGQLLELHREVRP